MPRYDELDQDLIVLLPSGNPFPAMNDDEVDFLHSKVDAYLDMQFQHVSDLAELDRLIQNELLCHRWNLWLSLGEDYNGKSLKPRLQDDARNLSLEIRQIKAKLGLDKLTRDRTRGEGSVPQRMTALMQRARAMGLHRCRQVERALELQNELIGLAQLYRNLKDHPEELRDMRVTPEDIMEWVEKVLQPEFEAIDEHWRTHEQHIWHLEDSRIEAAAS